MKKYLLEIIVFITGAGVMVFELVASRVLAPYVGTSILVWSSLIGVILAALSAGYWWGGRLADRKSEYYHFSIILLAAALSVGLAGIFKTPILNFLDDRVYGFRWEAVGAALILFAPGSFFMAASSPYAVRLKLANLKHSGATVGNLYAISTLGSIAGAFSTGWILVAYLGNTKIILLLAALLLLASLLVFSQRTFKTRLAGVATIILFILFSGRIDSLFLPKGTIVINSRYLDIFLQQGTDDSSNIQNNSGTNRPILKLSTTQNTTQSAMYLDNSTELVFPYTKFLKNLTRFFNPDIKTALVLGGAAYSLPKDFLRSYPQGKIDVVEIDPTMTQTAKKYFALPDSPRLQSYNVDGRVFLNHNTKKYDAVYMDVFNSFVPPFQLTTKETAQKIYDSLNDDGAVYLNTISSITGDGGKFFRAEYATYKKVFPQLYVFRVQVPFADVPQNLILVAVKSSQPVSLKSSNPLLNSYLEHAWLEPVPLDQIVITDDHAPVMDLILPSSKIVKNSD